MTDPVDTDALRKLLHNDTAVEVIRLRQALSAAADEVDRLRAAFDQMVPDYTVPQFARVLRDRDRLRAMIENAPHREQCRPHIACTCWKADAL